MKKQIGIVGSGFGSLTAACLLAKRGHEVEVFEQNYLPGGCSSAYFRKGYVFEAGATTVVGLDAQMPLRALAQALDLDWGLVKLEMPMEVFLRDGRKLQRHGDLNAWIAEAERVFGKAGQAAFWRECYEISAFVWRSSMQQLSFPPSRLRDVWDLLPNLNWSQFKHLPAAFRSMRDLLKKHGLLERADFVDFVDEQLLITAQNTHEEVNVLFGATALCYTLYGNFYMPGGLIQLVRPLQSYLEKHGGRLHLRCGIKSIETGEKSYVLESEQGRQSFDLLLSGIPINNTLDLWQGEAGQALKRRFERRVLGSGQLNSALQIGLGLAEGDYGNCLHRQIHLARPLEELGSKSIFLSLSHADDVFRAARGQRVASISTHLPNPMAHWAGDKEKWAEQILDELDARNFIKREQILYRHVSAAPSWASWTGRAWGFVGGYPQYLRRRPWQLLDARLDGRGAYLCGDTAYPGQGLPGVCLSGFTAVRKMELDGHLD